MAGTSSTKLVAFVTEAIFAPAGMLAPMTCMPGRSPVVLATVTVELPEVVEPERGEAA